MIRPRAHFAVPALLLLTAAGARAQDAVPAPFARVSIVSTDRASQIILDSMLPVPSDIASLIEQHLPFIGVGGIDGTRPLGLGFIMSSAAAPAAPEIIFAIPVKKDAATIAALDKSGAAAPLPDHPDMARAADKASFKRTADYLFFSTQKPELIQNMPNDFLLSDYKDKDTIAYGTLDIGLARKLAPDLVKNVYAKMREDASHRPGGDQPVKTLVQDAFFGFLESLDKITVTSAFKDKTIRVAGTISPSPLKTKSEFPKPVFPAGTCATINMVYPDPAAATWLTVIEKKGMERDPPIPFAKLTPTQIDQERQVMDSLCRLAIGDAQSAAVTAIDGNMVLTIVNQYRADTDAIAEFKKDYDTMESLDRVAGGAKDSEIEDWKSPKGAAGVRIRGLNGGPTVIIAQKGRMVEVAFSLKDLATLPEVTFSPTEKISDFFSLHVDLGGAAKALDSTPLAGQIPEAVRNQWAADFAGKELSLTVANNADGVLAVNAACPLDVLKEMLALMVATNEMHPAP